MLGLQKKKKREPAPYRYREVTYKIKISLNTRHIGRKGRARPVRLASAVGLDPVFMFWPGDTDNLVVGPLSFFFLFFFFLPLVKLEPSCLFPFLLFLHITAIRFPFWHDIYLKTTGRSCHLALRFYFQGRMTDWVAPYLILLLLHSKQEHLRVICQ